VQVGGWGVRGKGGIEVNGRRRRAHLSVQAIAGCVFIWRLHCTAWWPEGSAVEAHTRGRVGYTH
jgi:hypothetical protein